MREQKVNTLSEVGDSDNRDDVAGPCSVLRIGEALQICIVESQSGQGS